MSNTLYFKDIFTEFACSMRKVPVASSSLYRWAPSQKARIVIISCLNHCWRPVVCNNKIVVRECLITTMPSCVTGAAYNERWRRALSTDIYRLYNTNFLCLFYYLNSYYRAYQRVLYSGDMHGVYNDAHVRVLLITVVISTEQSSSVQTNGKFLTQKTVAVYSHSIRSQCEQRFGPHIYTVSQKNVPPLACYNFDAHEWILIFFWQKRYW